MKNEILISDFKKILIDTYGDAIKSIILFGSRTSCMAESFSDYDVLVIIKGPCDFIMERNIYSISYDLCLKYDVLIDVKIITTEELKTLKGKQPFIQNAIETGIYA